ncbi:MAG: histidinol dehydrogenase [Bacteroidota bacterium]
MKVFKYPTKAHWSALLTRPVMSEKDLENVVSPILDAVKRDGDAALKQFTSQFDKVTISAFAVSEKEIQEAESTLDERLKAAIRQAAENIRKFHQAQRENPIKVETMKGVECWRKSVPIDKVGIYIPGGTAPLFSTVLMLAIPAVEAGCKEIVLCSPPSGNGKLHPAIIYAATFSGVSKLFKVGGAQAIAAMAYGTPSIPRVFKIFGPGNQYVTAAKQLVTRDGTAIDMPAGPSEVAVLADETANPHFIAADLLSQAEHGADSQVILVTTSSSVIERVVTTIDEQLVKLPRKEIAIKALENSRVFLLSDEEACIELLNEYAPEHLILSISNADEVAEKITNAGSVFLGHFTPESVGDYASGTNHTLPTNGWARSFSGVSLDSFFKKITFQKLSREGLQNIGETVEVMAEAEGLEAHKQAVSIRLKWIKAEEQ